MSREMPVWVDGIRFESSTEACSLFKFNKNSFKTGASRGKFMGHTVSKVPPEPAKVKKDDYVSRSYGRLLRGEYCTHRLGVYHYQGV